MAIIPLSSRILASPMLSQIEQTLKGLPYGKQPVSLYDPIRYILSLGGKRLRPMLLVLSGQIFSKDTDEELLNMGAVAEVFHNFSLMHDDIMDNAPLRRGNATVHEKWDTNTAILSGDVMLVLAYQLLSRLPEHKLAFCLDAFNQVAREVCEGQQLDMEFERSGAVGVNDYLEMIRLKTAVLLGFCCKTGAFIGGASPDQVKMLYTFGESIGIGFQLADDLLDVFGDATKVGKRVGGDIASNKKTYLLIKAIELAKGTDAEELQRWLSNRDEQLVDDKIAFVTKLYRKLGVDEAAQQLADSYFSKGFAQLELLESNDKDTKKLLAFAQQLMVRDK